MAIKGKDTVESDGIFSLTVLAVSEPNFRILTTSVAGSDRLSVPTDVSSEGLKPCLRLPLRAHPRDHQQLTCVTTWVTTCLQEKVTGRRPWPLLVGDRQGSLPIPATIECLLLDTDPRDFIVATSLACTAVQKLLDAIAPRLQNLIRLCACIKVVIR